MTVSRVINGESNVRDNTRESVLNAVAELGYAPNKAARSLASGEQISIGLVYYNPSSTYLSAMLRGLLEQARASDTQIVVVECDTEEDGIKAILASLESGVDGVILPPPLADSPNVLNTLTRSRTLAVMVGCQAPSDRAFSVCIDDRAAAYSMTEHLIALGHNRIGFIAGNPRQSASALRLEGYSSALQVHGIAFDESLVVPGLFTYRSGLEAADTLLRLDARPTAIFACNDDMAAATVATAHRYRIDIPGDLSICGFDDTLLATTVWPEITTIHQPIEAMAHAAVNLLARTLRDRRPDKTVQFETIRLDYRLVRRGSDGPPRPTAAIASSR